MRRPFLLLIGDLGMWEFLVIYCVWNNGNAHQAYTYEETKIYAESMKNAQEAARLYAKAKGYNLRGLDIYRMGVRKNG